VKVDAPERDDVSAAHVQALADMKRQLAGFVASLGRFEAGEGDDAGGWPRALRRGIAGDVEAAVDVAGLLDDASVKIRRKAAEVLFELGRGEVAAQLRLAVRRDEDDLVRRWCALGLTRLGQGAPLVFDLVSDADVGWRRLAALALAEAGDDRGEAILLAWWRAAYPEEIRPGGETMPFERARQVVAALGRIKSKPAVGPLTWGLRDVRLRPHVAQALAAIGEEAARPADADLPLLRRIAEALDAKVFVALVAKRAA
jgi:HEAT repeat protein